MSLQTINFLSTKNEISELISEFALSNLSVLKSDFFILILSKSDYLKGSKFRLTQKSIDKIYINFYQN